MNGIDRLPPFPNLVQTPQPLQEKPQTGETFGDTLKGFVQDVNAMQRDAADKTMKFATGEIKDLHEVMAASEEASISLMLLIELRNKAVDAYKELMRTPV